MARKQARHLRLLPPPVQPMLPFGALPLAPNRPPRVRWHVVRKLANFVLQKLRERDAARLPRG